MKTLIIAEAGVNHNGSIDIAKKLVDAAYEAGADIVKFQTFKTEKLVTENAPKASYQESGESESQFQMLKKLELSEDEFCELANYCNQVGIEFLSTAFDSDSLKFLVDEIGLQKLKIPSGELSNPPLVYEHAKTGLELIISTGMSNITDIKKILGVVAYGGINGENPCEDTFVNAFKSREGQEYIKNKVTLLHCVSAYPAQYESINLNCMNNLKEVFNTDVGYSDHSLGIEVPIAAVSLGASVIEKHFTLDKTLPGPDHEASLDPVELKQMVMSIRNIEKSLGERKKQMQKCEENTRKAAHKSLVANTDIRKGDIFTEHNLAVKRPGTGISAYKYWSFMGERANENYSAGDLI